MISGGTRDKIIFPPSKPKTSFEKKRDELRALTANVRVVHDDFFFYLAGDKQEGGKGKTEKEIYNHLKNFHEDLTDGVFKELLGKYMNICYDGINYDEKSGLYSLSDKGFDFAVHLARLNPSKVIWKREPVF